jgi:hypothetical protein
VHKQGKLPIDDTLMMVDLLICKKGNKQEMHHGIKIKGKTHKPTEDSEFNFKSILANKIRLNKMSFEVLLAVKLTSCHFKKQ